MPRNPLGVSVFDAAIDRMLEIYEQGHRVVVSFSGGKDSTVAMEICVLAARLAGRLPVEVIMRDEEIMFPGTYEFAERTAQREDISFNWIYACQPIINVFNREEPFWWVFDPQLEPDQWVRQPPSMAVRIPDLNIERMTIPERFPPQEGKDLYAVIGLRVSESRGRLYGLFSSGGHITKPNSAGVRSVRPVYDWGDGDVWRAIAEQKWDYNSAYDVMARLGIPKKDLRIAPPTMNAAGVRHLSLAQKAWPKWFDRMCERLPGVRTAANYGMRAVQPQRKMNETWEQTFKRTCLQDAPEWIQERSERAMRQLLSSHAHHSHEPLPQVDPCYHCFGNIGSWRRLALAYYTGDPFSMKYNLPYVEPETFRAGAGTWGGTPTF